MLDTEFGVPTLFKLLPLIFTISLSVIAIVLSEYLSTILIYFKLSRVGYNIFSFLNQRFLIELFYNRYITGVILKLGGQTTKVIDKGSVEYLGPYGLEKGLLNISKNIARLNTGVITSYALYILIGLILYLLFNAYIHGSILILVLVISLSLVLFQSRKNITLTSVSLQSSTELQGLLARLNNFVQNIPSGEGMRTRAGDNVFGVADLAQNEVKTLVKLKRDVVKLADIEAKQPNVTQDVAEHITSIKDEAINVAVRGGDIIIEGMQATAD
jgi:uncharacterized membrane protein